MNENVCGFCRHYHLLPRPRDASGAVDMSQPQQGECREGPPHLTSLPTPQGQMQLCGYPPLPANFPACGRFEEAC